MRQHPEGEGDIEALASALDALRSFVAPPKPAEPTGLGAAIRCTMNGIEGKATRDANGGWAFCSGWSTHYGLAYAEFDAVTVLSEGVTA